MTRIFCKQSSVHRLLLVACLLCFQNCQLWNALTRKTSSGRTGQSEVASIGAGEGGEVSNGGASARVRAGASKSRIVLRIVPLEREVGGPLTGLLNAGAGFYVSVLNAESGAPVLSLAEPLDLEFRLQSTSITQKSDVFALIFDTPDSKLPRQVLLAEDLAVDSSSGSGVPSSSAKFSWRGGESGPSGYYQLATNTSGKNIPDPVWQALARVQSVRVAAGSISHSGAVTEWQSAVGVDIDGFLASILVESDFEKEPTSICTLDVGKSRVLRLAGLKSSTKYIFSVCAYKGTSTSRIKSEGASVRFTTSASVSPTPTATPSPTVTPSPTPTSTPSPFLSIGAKHSCAGKFGSVSPGGNRSIYLKCWGNNTEGALGQGDVSHRGDNGSEMGDWLDRVDLGPGRYPLAVASGGDGISLDFTCTLLDNGAVKCWGKGGNGQLGNENIVDIGDVPGEMGDSLFAVNLGSSLTAKTIAAGATSACAVLSNDTLKCWGANNSGALGLGDTSDRGDQVGEMGDSLPALSLGSGLTPIEVSVGSSFACALLKNSGNAKSVKCWGKNDFGQLGQGDTNARGDSGGEMGDSLSALDFGAGLAPVAITTGSKHACALLTGGVVKCWGDNVWGNLGLGDSSGRGDGANEMGSNLPAVNLGAGRTAKAIVAGWDHTCAILDNDSLKCWGDNSSGQLGLGDTDHRGNDPGEMGDLLPPVSLGTGKTIRNVSAGYSHTCAILNDGSIKCWGENGVGQLGLGDTADRGIAAGEMGDALPAVSFGSGF